MCLLPQYPVLSTRGISSGMLVRGRHTSEARGIIWRVGSLRVWLGTWLAWYSCVRMPHQQELFSAAYRNRGCLSAERGVWLWNNDLPQSGG